MCAIGHISIAQLEAPSGIQTNTIPDWGLQTKASSDSCGAYFNNYVGLGKTTSIRIESMRTGNMTENGEYPGRAQKFKAPQPIHVSGIEFYAFILNNPSMDSIMVITTLNNYDAGSNTIGAELARDTVYVTHQNFNPNNTPLPNISVQSYFEGPITVTSDYMITMTTPTDDSLKIIANDPTQNNGNGEGMGYALYDNVSFPSFFGWYDMIQDFAADYDFLMSPLIDFQIHDGFNLSDTLICPGVIDELCVTYDQMPIFSDNQYHANSTTPLVSQNINWGDNQMDSNTDSICHTYMESGVKTVSLEDIFNKWDNVVPTCDVELSEDITVLDSIEASFTFNISSLFAEFNSVLTAVDSVWWEFGDGSAGTDDLNPTHLYQTPGTYSVWLHVYNDCMTTSIFQTVTATPVSIVESNSDPVSFYPNPADKLISLSGLTNQKVVKLYDITGKSIPLNFTEPNQIDVSYLPNGAYFLKIEGLHQVITKKLIIKH